jgi:DNA oxidative demethylase
VLETARRAAAGAGCRRFDPTACLVNYYRQGGSLGMHRDDTPKEDLAAPIVTISLGDTALFEIGGAQKTDPAKTVELESGDVLVMWLVGRLLFHGVRRVLGGTSDLLSKGGRISATLRTVRG